MLRTSAKFLKLNLLRQGTKGINTLSRFGFTEENKKIPILMKREPNKDNKEKSRIMLKSEPKKEKGMNLMKSEEKKAPQLQNTASTSIPSLKKERLSTEELKSKKKDEEPATAYSTKFKEGDVADVNSASYLLSNSTFSKYFTTLKNFHAYSFEKTYNAKVTENIKDKISSIEREIDQLKERNNTGDKKIQNMRVSNETPSKETPISKPSSLVNEIFSMCKSIKEIEAKIATLPSSTLKDITFKYKILSFYADRNIDKAFEYFYENLNQSVEGTMGLIHQKEFISFLTRLVELDKTPYLTSTLEFIEKNNMNLSSLIPVHTFTDLFFNFLEHHMVKNVNYEGSVVGLKFVLLYIKSMNVKKENLNLPVDLSAVFDVLAESKFKSRKVGAKNDEMLSIVNDYAAILSKKKFGENDIKVNRAVLSFKEESLSKVVTLFFDNSIALSNEEGQNLFNLLFTLSKKHSNFIELINENLIAYYQFFGFPPRVLSANNLKNAYFGFRGQIMSDKKSVVLTESELEFFIQLFKYNNMYECIGDVLSNWTKFTQVEENASKAYHFALGDFILNSSLEKESYYHKKVEEVYSSKDKSFSIDCLVMKTLAVLKDGNKDFAVSNFFSELEAQMKFSRENDKDLVDLYNRAFGVSEVKDLQAEEAPVYYEADVDFEFTLRKVNLIEKSKQSIKSLYNTFVKETDSTAKAKQKLDNATKNLMIATSKDQTKNQMLNNLRDSVKKLTRMNIEEVKEEIKMNKETENENLTIKDKLEDLYSQIKVSLFLDSNKFSLLSSILNKKIDFINDLHRLEFDHQEKNELIFYLKDEISMNIHSKEDQKFLKLVQEYLTLKPVSYTKTVLLDENTIRNVQDTDSLFNYNKVDEYVDTAVAYFKRMQQRNSKELPLVSENLKFLNQIGVDLQKVYLENITSEDKISYLQNIVNNYKNILLNLQKKENSSRSLKNLPFNRMVNLKVLSSMNNVISRDSKDLHRESKLVAKLGHRYVYHRLITLNKINNHRQRNIIKAINTYHSKKTQINTTNSIPNLIGTFNYVRVLNNTNNVYTSTLKSLTKLEENVRDQDEENNYIDSVFDTICQSLNYEVYSAVKEVESISDASSENVSKGSKIKTMKELLGQEYQNFTVKHAIYMMLYGAENNLPEAIRMAEKVCSDYGYVVPSWVETRINKYLVQFSSYYADTVEKIGPVNVTNVYRNNLGKGEVFDDHGVESAYDAYKTPSIWAKDHLPFQGLEEVVDLKKFTLLLRNSNRGSSSTSHVFKF